MDICAEFHCHTTASDGILSPCEVVKIGKKLMVSSLAITDHDTVSGIDEALKCAKELNVPFIPGIELSCNHNNESIHILGFFKGNGYKDHDLLIFLEELKESRKQRANEIVFKLKKYFKIHIKPEEISKLTKGVIARPHIAKAIINSGYDYDFTYIFENFIGNKCPAYVPNKHISVEDGVKLLKSFGCIVILAHPKLIRKSAIDDLFKYGFDGIEAIYFQNTPKETKRFYNLAQRKNLLITCGSDFHGNTPGDTKHGNIGDMKISTEDFNKFMNKYKL